MVLEPYAKRLRFFCMVMAMSVGVAVTWRYWLTAPRTDAGVWRAFAVFWLTFYFTLAVVTILGTIYVKRIFRPHLEDYEEYSKQAHYTAL
jgi:type VI protein secretion system component VasK